MNQTINKEAVLLHNGKCNICGKRIKFLEEDGFLIKTRLLKISKKDGYLVKCPNCKTLINF